MPLKTRRHHNPEEKVRMLRLHFLEGRAISEICDAEGIHLTQFYQWQKTFFENGTAAFERRSAIRAVHPDTQKAAALESKICRKDEVIAQIMEEFVLLKKSLGAI
jgi:transposase-like protein